MNRDIIKENGGTNLFSFVQNNPTGLIDPSGLIGSVAAPPSTGVTAPPGGASPAPGGGGLLSAGGFLNSILAGLALQNIFNALRAMDVYKKNQEMQNCVDTAAFCLDNCMLGKKFDKKLKIKTKCRNQTFKDCVQDCKDGLKDCLEAINGPVLLPWNPED